MPLAGPVLWELIPGEPGNRRPRRSAIAIKRKGKLKKVNTLFRNFFEMGVDGFPACRRVIVSIHRFFINNKASRL